MAESLTSLQEKQHLPAAQVHKQHEEAQARQLPKLVEQRGISVEVWKALCNLYPGALSESVLLVWDYCRARKLDPLKKPCHIVPMEVNVKKRDPNTKQVSERKIWKDVVMPGIYEHRTTAQRTGEYLGHTEPVYADLIEYKGVEAPEWCSMTMRRYNRASGQVAEFPVRAKFIESVGLKKSGRVNARWTRAPEQMLTKCTEAAGLREAFPEELGGQPTAEEMQGSATLDESDDDHGTAPPSEEDDVIDGEIVEERESTAAPAAEAKPQAAEKSAPQTGRPNITLEALLSQLTNAKNSDDVAVVQDLVRELPKDEQKIVKRRALTKMAEFVGGTVGEDGDAQDVPTLD